MISVMFSHSSIRSGWIYKSDRHSHLYSSLAIILHIYPKRELSPQEKNIAFATTALKRLKQGDCLELEVSFNHM